VIPELVDMLMGPSHGAAAILVPFAEQATPRQSPDGPYDLQVNPDVDETLIWCAPDESAAINVVPSAEAATQDQL